MHITHVMHATHVTYITHITNFTHASHDYACYACRNMLHHDYALFTQLFWLHITQSLRNHYSMVTQ
jgi:hypothetical protein